MAERCTYFVADLTSLTERTWRPAADVYRSCDGWLIKLDLAGVRASDIRVAVEGRRLIVSGERRDWLASTGHHPYSMEIIYDRFERVVEFPCELDQPQMEVEFRDGWLLIAIRCQSESTAKET